MEKETYTIKVYCGNCGWEGVRQVKRGLISETAEAEECPHCGCRDIKVNKNWDRKITNEDF